MRSERLVGPRTRKTTALETLLESACKRKLKEEEHLFSQCCQIELSQSEGKLKVLKRPQGFSEGKLTEACPRRKLLGFLFHNCSNHHPH